MSRNAGKYQAEALRQRRDDLLRKRRYGHLSPYEGMELDAVIAEVGEPAEPERPSDRHLQSSSPSGQSTAEPSPSQRGEDSGPVGLGQRK